MLCTVGGLATVGLGGEAGEGVEGERVKEKMGMEGGSESRDSGVSIIKHK